MKTFAFAVLAAAVLAAPLAHGQEAVIRKVLPERFPNFPKIDEVTKSPVPGLYEVRFGTEVLYTDEGGNYVIQGAIIDTKTRANLTEERIEKLTAIDFSALPLKDAIVIKQGSGARKLAVFVDPNCGYCKRFERDLTTIKDVTIYTFLYPILGPDSNQKSRDIWCSKEPGKTWRAWMVDGVVPARTMGGCDTEALDRNLALGRKHRVQGTPALVFENNVRKPGALPAAQVEQLLVAAATRKP